MGGIDVRTALERARKDRPELRRTIELMLDLIDEPPPAPVPPFFVAAAAARLAAGRPAIDPAELSIDWAAFERRLRQVCAVIERHDARMGIAARAVAEGDTRGLAVRFLLGEQLDDITAFVLTHSLKPFLRPLSQAALGLAAAREWTRGECPGCGGPPDFAVLAGEGGARRLLCSRCDSEWAYARVGCPFCGNRDPKTLGYFPAGDGRHRLYVCDSCRRYVKTLDLRETWDEAPLPAERILAVGLDIAAADAGYAPR